MAWSYKEEVIVSQENFCHLEKSICYLINYVMKTELTDAESREEHNATKYRPIGQTTADLWTFLCPSVMEIMEMEKEKNLKEKCIFTIMKKVIFLARFVD